MHAGAVAGIGVVVVTAAIALVPVRFEAHSVPAGSRPRPGLDSEAPQLPVSLLFIHHSVGEQLLANPSAPDQSATSTGGGLKRLLESQRYRVHSVTYGSALGEHTDLFDFPAKFRDHLDELLVTRDGKATLAPGESHDVIMFKACFPNNRFVGLGTKPGNPAGPELTVENAKAAMLSLLPEFQKHPTKLFVFLTTPPLSPQTYPTRLGKWLARAALGQNPVRELERHAELSRVFADWAVAKDGWLASYPSKNVVVIDYYDMLTGHGQSNLLAYPGKDGADSHPSGAGQRQAAPALAAELNRAVARFRGAEQHSAAKPESPR